MRGNLYAALLLLILIVCGVSVYSQPTFTEVAAAKGIDITGNKDGGFAWADFNNDGWLDLLVNTDVGGSRSQLFYSNGSTTFTNVTSTHANGLQTDFNTERQAIYGDIDNDGDLDIAVNTSGTTAGQGIKIFKNKGPNATPPYSFGDASQEENQLINSVPGGMDVEGMSFLDYNNDGFLDLVFENGAFGIDIYENDGTGFFTYVDNAITGFPTSATSGDYASATDFDNDGYVDYIARKEDALDFHRNLGNGTFATVPGFNEQANNGNKGGVMMCDFDNDTDFDLFWTSAGTNQIWRQQGVGSGIFVATNEPATSAGVTIGNGIDGCTCGDVDNDGDIDLFLTDDNGPSFLFINRTPNGSTSTFDFFQPDRGVDAGQPYDVNYGINVGANGEGVSFVDYDNDGDLDLYININGGQNQLWENDLDNNNYMAVCLERTLADTIRQVALGANALIKNCNDSIISGIREVNSANGHGTQLPHFVHFGIPNPTAEVIVEVYFPWRNGERDTLRYSVQPDTVTGECLTLLEEFSNETPVPADDTFWVCINTTDTINVQANDTDPNGDSLSTTTIIGPFQGIATVFDDKNIQYIPNPGYLGPDSLIYVVCDTGLGYNPCQIDYPKCDSAIVRISVIEQSNATDPGNPSNPLFNDIVEVSITLNVDTTICLPLDQGFFDDTLVALNSPAFPGASLIIENDTCVRYITPATGPTPFRDTIQFTLCNQCGCDTIEFRFNYQPEDCYDGIDNDGDGLVDCEDGDCPGTYPLLWVQIDTHYAVSIRQASGIGINFENNALGAPDGNTAQVYENGDLLGLDFQDTIPAGTTMYLRWGKRPGSGGIATPDLWQSIDYSSFTPVPSPPSYGLGSPVLTTSTFTTTIDTRYFRFGKGGASLVDYQIDAIWWIEIDSSILCLPNMFAEDDLDTTGFQLPDTVNVAVNDSAYLDSTLWNFGLVIPPVYGSVTNSGGLFIYQPDSSLALGGLDSFSYSFCDTSNPTLCDTATVVYFIFGMEICDDGIDNDGDGLADCYDSDCPQFVPDTSVSSTSGFADVVTVDNGVGSEAYALGPPDIDGAQIRDAGDILVLDLTDTIPAGQFYTIVWAKRFGQVGIAELNVRESTDGSTFGPTTTYTTPFGSPTMTSTTVQASIDTRYLRFMQNTFVDIEVDAIVYTIYDSSFFCSPNLLARTDYDTVDYVTPDTINVTANDTAYLPPAFWNISVIDSPAAGSIIGSTSTGFIYQQDSTYVLPGLDSFSYSLCDSSSPALCDTGWVYLWVIPEEICGDGIDNNGNGLTDCNDSAACVPVIDSIYPTTGASCVNDTISYSVNPDPKVALYKWEVSFESVIIQSNFFNYEGPAPTIDVRLGSPSVQICLILEYNGGCESAPSCDIVNVNDVPPPAPSIRR